jgi:hypothetical protein
MIEQYLLKINKSTTMPILEKKMKLNQSSTLKLHDTRQMHEREAGDTTSTSKVVCTGYEPHADGMEQTAGSHLTYRPGHLPYVTDCDYYIDRFCRR